MNKVHKAVGWFALLMFPVVVAGNLLFHGDTTAAKVFNELGFVWILSVAYHPVALLLDRGLRESLMARLAGFREGDERERLVTAEAARRTFLLMLALQMVLMLMTFTSVRLARHDAGGGSLNVGLGVDSRQMLDVFMTQPAGGQAGAEEPGTTSWGGHVLPHNLALVLAVLVLVQLGAFRLFASSRYEGAEA